MSNLKLALSLVTALFMVAPFAAVADEHAEKGKPFLTATQQVKVETIVEAMNYDTREVTLKGPEGGLVTVVAKNTPNLEDVAAGDRVDVEYLQNLTIEVLEGEGAVPGQGVMTVNQTNQPGEAPAGMEAVTTITAATIAAINLENNTFKLNMPDETVQEFTAMVPENLKRVEVGDLVVVTATEAIAAQLVELPAE